MKQKLNTYNIYIFGEEKPFTWVSQEKAQKIMMALATQNPPKFLLIDNEMIASSSISRIEIKSMWEGGGDYRELTASEIETQKKFDEFKNKGKLLLN